MKSFLAFILLFISIVIFLSALILSIHTLSLSAEGIEVSMDPEEGTRGKNLTINLSVTSDTSEELRVRVFKGRYDLGGMVLADENLTLVKDQEETFSFSFSPTIGQNQLFIYNSGSSSGNESMNLTIWGSEDYSDVLLIMNNNSADSKDIGNHFLQFFDSHVLYVDAPAKETITREEFDDVRGQIEDFLFNSSLEDEINYLVTTKGVPLRVSGSGNASFDSELTLILGQYASDIGRDDYRYNPYHDQNEQFSRASYDIYLVTRLTGYTTEDAKGLIDKGIGAFTMDGMQELLHGLIILDVDPAFDGGGHQVGNDWMRDAAELLEPKGFDVMLDETNTFVRHRENISIYASWGSNDHYDFIGHGKNTGMESDSNGDDEPNDWSYQEGGGGEMTRTNEDKRSGGWSVRIIRNSTTGESTLLQRFTPEPGWRYYLRGYTNTTGVSGSGGVQLVIRHFDATDTLLGEVKGAYQSGTTSAWTTMGMCHIEPVEGTEYVLFGAIFSEAEGTAYLDDIQLVEIVPNNSYLNGSLAETFVSTGSRSFIYPTYTPPTNYGQSLIADVIRSGVTGIKGYVYEPYLSAVAHPNILFDSYTKGWNLAESYYAASIKLSWMDVVVGVPKLAPFSLLPDLEISQSTILVEQDPSNSMNRTIYVTILNTGGSLSGSWTIDISVSNDSNDTEFWNFTLPGAPLFPGESLMISLPWTAPEADTYNLEFTINHTGFERQSDNNHFSMPVEVLSPPDLIPQTPFPLPAVPQEDTDFEINLTLNNAGESFAGDVNISLFIQGSFVQARKLDVGGQENNSCTFSLLSLPAGLHDVRIIVDPHDIIRETNESNNEIIFQIRVNAPPMAVIGKNRTTRVGIPLSFNGSSSYDIDGTITRYRWSVDGFQFSDPEMNYTFPMRKNYTVILTVTDDNEAETQASITVFVENTPPVARFDIPQGHWLTFEDITFDARQSSDNDSTPLTYYWDFGGGTVSSNAIKKTFYSSPGRHIITLTVWDDMNESSSLSREIIIGNRPPEPEFSITYQGVDYSEAEIPTTSFLSHIPLILNLSGSSDPDGSIGNISIDFGDGIMFIGQFSELSNDSISHTYLHSGTYVLSIRLEDHHQGETERNLTIQISNEPPQAEIIFLPNNVSSHQMIFFISRSSDNGQITSSRWQIEGISHSVSQISYTFTTYGYHSVILTVTDDEGLTGSQEKRIYVQDLPPDITAEDVIAIQGKPIRIEWNASDRDGGISHYLVTLPGGDQKNISTPYIDLTFQITGPQNITVTVVDDYGLSNSTTISVIVVQESKNSHFPIEIVGIIAALVILGAVVIAVTLRKS